MTRKWQNSYSIKECCTVASIKQAREKKLPKKLPSSKEEAVALLKARVGVREFLTLEELALVLWYLGTIDVTPRHDLGLAYLQNACLEQVAITGVPEGGVWLAQGVFTIWSTGMAELVPMSKVGRGTGFRFSSRVSFGAKPVLVVDNDASTGTTVKQAVLAVRKREGEVAEILVLVDRQEGAFEGLQALPPPPPRLVAAITMSTVAERLAHHELIAAETPTALADYRAAVLEAIRNSSGLACYCEVCLESQD